MEKGRANIRDFKIIKSYRRKSRKDDMRLGNAWLKHFRSYSGVPIHDPTRVGQLILR